MLRAEGFPHRSWGGLIMRGIRRGGQMVAEEANGQMFNITVGQMVSNYIFRLKDSVFAEKEND